MRPGLAQTAPNGRVFEQRTYDAGFPDLGTITGIAIVFDEGNDVGEGFVYLDDVSITANGVTHTWTSASDNGNGQTITQDPTGEVYLSSLLGLPLTLL